MQVSIHRIWLLVRKQWAENQQLYTLGLLALAGIIAAIIIFDISASQGFDKNSQQTMFCLSMTVAGSIFATNILSQFNTKHAGIQALMLPASTFEKFAVAVIYSLVIFPVCFVVIVYPLIVMGHYIDVSLVGNNNSLYIIKWGLEESVFLFLFLMLQSVALFCSVLFRRYVFIKAVILVIAVLFGIIVVNPYIAKHVITIDTNRQVNAHITETFYDNKHNIIGQKVVTEPVWTRIRSATPFADLEVNNWFVKQKHNNVTYASYSLSVRNSYNAIFYALLVISIPLLWLITWFRLKEKEL